MNMLSLKWSTLLVADKNCDDLSRFLVIADAPKDEANVDEIFILAQTLGSGKTDEEIANLIADVPNMQRQIAAQAAEIERLKQAVLDEREACAKVCDAEYESYDEYDRERDGALFCADAIRARGEVK